MSRKDRREHFENVLKFLKDFQFIYNYPNTDILINDIFSKCPKDWFEYFRKIQYENVNDLILNQIENSPESFREFLTKIKSLKLNVGKNILMCSHERRHNSCLNKKKLYEILNLAPHIDDICKDNSINLIIDIGAGLGHLSHFLNDHYGYPVLGLECSDIFVKKSYEYQKKFYPKCESHVVFVQTFLEENNFESIPESIRTNFGFIKNDLRVCLVGLHACADLSVTILKLFLKFDFVKCLIIMPCCYHRMKINDENCDGLVFENFPLSKKLGDVFRNFNGERFLKLPFMRMACQQTLNGFLTMTPEDHQEHAKRLMYRNVLQLGAESSGYTVRRLKRKSSNSPKNFETYLTTIRTSHEILQPSSPLPISSSLYDKFLKDLRETWTNNDGLLLHFEILTGLQADFQLIGEQLILFDRIEFLHENFIKNCFVVKVIDDVVSPRCHALIASK